MTEVRAQRMRAQGTAFPLAGVGLGENTRKTFWRKWYWNRNQDYEPTKINQMGAKWGRRGKAISERGTSRNKATEVITGKAELRSTLGLVLAEYSASEMSIEDEAGKVAKSWATKWGLHSVFKASIEAKQWQGQACILERGWGSRVSQRPRRDRRMSKNVVFRPVALRDPCKSEVARVLVVAIKYAKVL